MSIYSLLANTLSEHDSFASASTASSSQSTASVDTHTKALLVEIHTMLTSLSAKKGDGDASKEEMQTQNAHLLCLRDLAKLGDDLNNRIAMVAYEHRSSTSHVVNELRLQSARQLEFNYSITKWMHELHKQQQQQQQAPEKEPNTADKATQTISHSID